jgi:UDP-N-acetylmuramate dehydrogenase
MSVKEHVSLAPLTTFHIGGHARFFIEAQSEKDVADAISLSREQELPLYVLGGGSNVLVRDGDLEGVVLHVALQDTVFENDGHDTLLSAGAGTSWDRVVDLVGARGVFGIENLAGIPGTLGGAVVQNIGAYGVEFANVFESADVIHRVTGECRSITLAEAAFSYRTSFFKKNRDYVITRATLRFKRGATPDVSYPDLARRKDAGESLTTPAEIAQTVRGIRSQKFPHRSDEGTAGSFFKNPIISREHADELSERFPGLPLFPQEKESAKISLAWLLDHALSLKGHSVGHVRLYENQPLVIVARAGATAREVSAFANDVAERVLKMTGITLEREVETVGE